MELYHSSLLYGKVTKGDEFCHLIIVRVSAVSKRETLTGQSSLPKGNESSLTSESDAGNISCEQ